MAPLVQVGLYLLVGSIPFEYPERSIPLEIPTLTGAAFLLTTLFHPRACYGRVPTAVLWFAAYLAVFVISVAASGGEYTSLAVAEFVVILQGVLVLLAAGNLMQDEKVARRSMVTLVAACAVRAALPLLGFAKTADAVWTGGERVSALGQNANNAAMILAAGLVALIGLTFIRRSRSRLRFIITGLLGALLGLAVLETGSRGGLASLLGGMLIFALAADSLRVRLRNGAIAVVAISLLAFATVRLPVMKNRLEDSMRTGNMAGREQLYPALWTMFLEQPVLGWGPVTNTYELARRIGERERPHRAAHNIVLELLTATGLVGTVPFLVGAWLCVRGAWQARRGEHGVLPLALFASVLIANMSGDWIASKLVWLVLAYALASGRWPAPAARLRKASDPVRRQLGVNGRGSLAGAPAAALVLPLGGGR
jgi:O-antigen ligase/polysaccharide polymerase Wzy-like membrane protein